MKMLFGTSALAVAFGSLASSAFADDDVAGRPAAASTNVLTYAERSVDLENGTTIVRSGFVRVIDRAGSRNVAVFGADGRRVANAANDPAASCFDLASRIVPVASRSTLGVPTDAGTLDVAFASGRAALPMILDVEPLGSGVARANVDGTLAATPRVATFGGSVDFENGIVLGAQFATASSVRGSGVTRGTCRLDLVLPNAPAAASAPTKAA